MKQTVVQLVVALLGLVVLVWGEMKHYADSHPEMMTTFDLEAKKAEPLQYFMYQVAYDPNNKKTWYLHNDGLWYDKPPQIRKRENQNQATLGTGNGSSGTPGYRHGQPAQTQANPQRY
jgi:hypothetical protein